VSCIQTPVPPKYKNLESNGAHPRGVLGNLGTPDLRLLPKSERDTDFVHNHIFKLKFPWWAWIHWGIPQNDLLSPPSARNLCNLLAFLSIRAFVGSLSCIGYVFHQGNFLVIHAQEPDLTLLPRDGLARAGQPAREPPSEGASHSSHVPMNSLLVSQLLSK
jgi:hypothetical protein